MSIGPVLRWPDYVVIGLTLIISVVLGLIPACTGGRQKTTSEYLTADRSLHLFPVALSLLVTYMSGITLLGIATEVYYFGIQFWFWMFGHIFGAIFTMVLYVPLLYPLGINSTNQVILRQTFKYACLYKGKLFPREDFFFFFFACQFENSYGPCSLFEDPRPIALTVLAGICRISVGLISFSCN